MNPAIQAVLDHVKTKVDANGDGKVDKADLDLIINVVKNDSSHALFEGQQLAGALVQKTSPFTALALAAFCGGGAGILITLAYMRMFH